MRACPCENCAAQQRMDVQHAHQRRFVGQLGDRHFGMSLQARQRQARHAQRDAQRLPRRDVIHLRLHERGARLHGQAAQLRRLVGRDDAAFQLVVLDLVDLAREADQRLVDHHALLRDQDGEIVPLHLRHQIDTCLTIRKLRIRHVDVGDRAGQPELIGGLDDLRAEDALIIARAGRADGVRFVSDERVRVDARLNRLAKGHGDVGLGLDDDRTIRQRHLLQLGERKLPLRIHRRQ